MTFQSLFPRPLTLLLALTLLTPSLATTCYTQTGNSKSWTPCNSTTNTGACCDIAGGDVCSTSGLCYSQSIPGFIYQAGCTDSNWGSSCPDFCPEKTDGPWNVHQCNDLPEPGTWCCRLPGADDCCTNATQVFTTDIGALMIATAKAVVSVSSSTSTVTSAATTTGGVSGQGASCSKEKSDTAPFAAVGAALGVALLASLGVLFWRERTRPRAEKGKVLQLELDGNEKRAYQTQTQILPVEADGQKKAYVYELQGGRPRDLEYSGER